MPEDVVVGAEVVILHDVSATGRERPWRAKRLATELLANVYDSVNPAKALRLRGCATQTEWHVLPDTGKKRLKQANFCHVRLCPMCSWRRSLKIFAHTQKVVDAAGGKYDYLLLTLTVRNVTGNELGSTLDMMMSAWHRMTRWKIWKGTVKGWYRGLEVTHNVDIRSSSYDTYHPHFHVLLAVGKDYYKHDYISHDDWASMWRTAMGLSYDPVVDIRKVTGTTGAAVAEVAKYAVKDGDYLLPEDWDLSIDTVRVLDRALDSRRLVAYGGKLKELHRRLNLDDEIDGNLVEVGDQESLEDDLSAGDIYTDIYYWHVGYSQYVLGNRLVYTQEEDDNRWATLVPPPTKAERQAALDLQVQE